MDTLPPPPAEITVEITATWTPPFKARNHDRHQDVLQNHANAKQARRELHRRTHGRKLKYCGNLL